MPWCFRGFKPRKAGLWLRPSDQSQFFASRPGVLEAAAGLTQAGSMFGSLKFALRVASLGVLFLCILWSASVQPLLAQEPLSILARVGPWPVASRLVTFDGGLWLANSIKGVNHNSADLYRYDPKTGDLDYQVQLFSQDAGRPLVHDGRLYWPLEDSRFSLGWGEVAVTDGQRWQTRTIPTAQIFHAHAIAPWQDGLIAATSAWRAGFQFSRDAGRLWQEIYDHPTPEGRVSRITTLLPLGEAVVGRLVAPDQSGLLIFDKAGARPLPGWPNDRPMGDMTVQGDWLFGLVRMPEGRRALWRSDGRISEPLALPEGAGRAQALAADSTGLWLATLEEDGGSIWRLEEAQHWRHVFSLTGGRPWEIIATPLGPFAAGAGNDGQGILWGPAADPAGVTLGPRAKTFGFLVTFGHVDWTAEGEALDVILDDPETYRSYRGGLRERLLRLAQAGPPEGFFTARLGLEEPGNALSLIGGAVEIRAWKLRRWLLLWAMARSGTGPVPLALLDLPWTAAPNRAEKYFETVAAAVQAVAATGQSDRATLEALVRRLGRADDPSWFKGDIIGALAALTGQDFAYDIAAWQAWWAEAQNTWPEG